MGILLRGFRRSTGEEVEVEFEPALDIPRVKDVLKGQPWKHNSEIGVAWGYQNPGFDIVAFVRNSEGRIFASEYGGKGSGYFTGETEPDWDSEQPISDGDYNWYEMVDFNQYSWDQFSGTNQYPHPVLIQEAGFVWCSYPGYDGAFGDVRPRFEALVPPALLEQDTNYVQDGGSYWWPLGSIKSIVRTVNSPISESRVIGLEEDLASSVEGVQGPPGDDGAPGADGEQGPPGADGADGIGFERGVIWGLEVTSGGAIAPITINVAEGVARDGQGIQSLAVGNATPQIPGNTIILNPGDETLDRIDAVCTAHDTGLPFGPEPAWDIFQIEGSASESPVAPDIMGNTYYVPLAYVLVPAGATSADDCTITDARSFVTSSKQDTPTPLISPNGSRHLLVVGNDGTLSTDIVEVDQEFWEIIQGSGTINIDTDNSFLRYWKTGKFVMLEFDIKFLAGTAGESLEEIAFNLTSPQIPAPEFPYGSIGEALLHLQPGSVHFAWINAAGGGTWNFYVDSPHHGLGESSGEEIEADTEIQGRAHYLTA